MNTEFENDTPDPASAGHPQTPEQLMQAASARIAELEAELAEMKDRWVRSEAETANVRARARRELDETRQYAVQKFAADVAEAADNLRRGLDAIPPAADHEPEIVGRLRDGFAGVERSWPCSNATASCARIRPETGSIPTCTRRWPSRKAPRTRPARSCMPGPRAGR